MTIDIRRYLKNIIIIVLCLVVLVCISGCKKDTTETLIKNIAIPEIEEYNFAVDTQHKLTIAMVAKSLDNPGFLDTKEEGERVANELGIKFEWYAPGETDSQEQEEIIYSLINKKVDAIAVSCIEPEKMEKCINDAVKAGIVVATFDSDSPNSNRIFYCGTNNYKAGRICGEKLLEILSKENKLGQDLNTVIMTGNLGSYNLNRRIEGFMDYIVDQNISLTNIDTLECNDDMNRAAVLLEQYVQNNVDTDLFVAVGGWPLLVPTDSLPLFQTWCKNGGISIVVDTFYPIVDNAKKGLADALIGQDFKKMGEVTVQKLYDVLMGEEISATYYDTGLEIGDESNFDILLENKEPWEIK